MTYNKFKIEHLKTKLNLTVVSEYWLETTLEAFPKDAILDSLLSEAPKSFFRKRKSPL